MVLLRRNYKILFLCFAIFGVYYPAIFSQFNLADDDEVFGRMEEAGSSGISGLLFSSSAGYYRPLTTITFLFDKAVWGFDPGFMHLENIIIHVLNAVLVFLIAENVFTSPKARDFELPLLSALVFAFHPINTEAVNWIAGRFDLLASFFVLAALLLIHSGLVRGEQRYYIFSALLALIGSFAKETAVFFFPLAMFFVYRNGEARQGPEGQPATSTAARWKGCLPFAAAFATYFLLRASALMTKKTGVGLVADQIARGVSHDFIGAAGTTLKAFGFYVKKLFVPLPLNFAIDSVSDLYVFIGIIALLFAFYFLIRRTLVTDYLLMSFYLISSGIVVLFASTAWTPVAERYLYLSSALFSIAFIGVLFSTLVSSVRAPWFTIGALLIVFASAFVTVQRNLLWQSNLGLYEDTVRKSPDFLKMKNILAKALRSEGRIAEADALLTEITKAKPGYVVPYINQAELRLGQGRPEEARTIITKAFSDKKMANPEVLKMLSQIDEVLLEKSHKPSRKAEITEDLVVTYEILFLKTGNPLFLYRSGQLLLVEGDKRSAGRYFRRAYEAAPDGTYFKDPAKKLAERLGG